MEGSVALLQQAERYAHAFDRVPGAHLAEGISDGLVRSASDGDLLGALRDVAVLGRLVDAERVRLAGEVARRSVIGGDSLADRLGDATAAALTARETDLPRSQAAVLVRLGEEVRPREALTGEVLPPARAHIAAALESGRIGLIVASAIGTCLGKVAHDLDPAALEDLERQLVETATGGWTVNEVLTYLKRVPDMIDPENAESRERAVLDRASVRRTQLETGITRWVLDLDPVTDGLFTAAVDANSALRRVRFLDEEESAVAKQAAASDHRTMAQRRVDAIRLVARKALRVDDGEVGGTAVTMLVTIPEEALRSGLGSGVICGVDEPISATTARILAADAELIPVVLGGAGQVLDLGTGRRFFSEVQRRAIAARDGGCAGPGCTAPPSWCDAAHISPAGYGPTSVDNGVLLCWHCHDLHDRHGWQIERRDAAWWWLPPPGMDPRSGPRPGGPPPPPRI